MHTIPSSAFKVQKFKVQQVVEKGSECFESLSMNGKSSMISKPLRSS
jgi:hypothetical protein